ncbi:iron dependent repressor, metal binding/dimerization domain protein [Treponema socranskii subsp. socranskii VPI DR56BR1116 = ATCC 35536]|uniref:Transcriptional regulator MntR n=1 Tax=Treponema socranskii subsp. socranskii VPI DR56BR1116 = ATCC 35536 TaxID=1125725 RepID=U2LLI1_TRESO|nr:metal-dependent transcriptional regulator [Treponema socranskii]ERF60942.1 iron dependent repressor, metal binding/dimerization domain protein [Treponema socranskii subsp. socranskii VPI DR56BR1116 = ATCC 35536]ERK05081.1 iron dependent repressor, metal binding/dimerization domain protein [Treponema socranskii subsp. socranskii VPI DR56BR1116 = ATCC 35536]
MYESGEDYLEAILRVKNVKGTVHSVDVAKKLGVSKPSVSRAVGILKRDGYLADNESTELEFTKKGLEKATNIYSRHRLLTDFFVKITGVSKEQAEENACRVEHDIDADIVAGIEKWMKKKQINKSL